MAARMLDEAELRLMSREQRARLARTIAALDLPRPGRDSKVRMRRNIVLAVVLGSCAFLAVWIVVLALTLPSHYKAGGWAGCWVGLDIAELLALASVAWTAWRGKQLLIVAMIVTATLMCCDAWFDLTLDWGTPSFSGSLLSALCAELPLALMMALGARRLLRLSVATTMALQGEPGPVPPLWQVPLPGVAPSTPLANAESIEAVADLTADHQETKTRPVQPEPAGESAGTSDGGSLASSVVCS